MNRYTWIGLSAAMMVAAGPIAAQTWQAVAVSPTTGQDGYSFGHASRAEAEREAKEACQTADCEIVSSSQQCLLLVQAPRQRAFAVVVPADELKTSAVGAIGDLCRGRGQQDCAIKRSVCDEQVQAESILD